MQFAYKLKHFSTFPELSELDVDGNVVVTRTNVLRKVQFEVTGTEGQDSVTLTHTERLQTDDLSTNWIDNPTEAEIEAMLLQKEVIEAQITTEMSKTDAKKTHENQQRNIENYEVDTGKSKRTDRVADLKQLPPQARQPTR